ncbi:MAG TPA: MBL fold metallo-hydrolase [Dermatophilaceae bacterium]|nr:MBL fold metallo-hydrolase [Dermatophilaceae bacterium]
MTPGWQGGPVTSTATCVLAPNPTPMTLEGTNTWVLGTGDCVVVDPGPLDEDHLQRVLAEVSRRDGRVAVILLTHRHWDHAEAAGRFAELSGAPVRAASDGLAEGQVLAVGGLELLVVTTPGHTGDSVSFLLPSEAALLTGDTVLGRGTSVVAWPDGDLAAYLASLERIERLARTGTVTAIWPGHGPVVPDAAGTVRWYLQHRRERLDQVRDAVAAGAVDADAVVERVYADVPREVWPAARLSVLAQLAYLTELSERDRGMTR